MLRNEASSWAAMKVEGYGTYLGHVVGPEAGPDTWKKPMAKYREAARMWSKTGLGLQFAAVAYTTYVLPILGFVAQLCPLPSGWEKSEASALRAMVPGPGGWCDVMGRSMSS